MKEYVRPLSFLRVDGKLEGRYRMICGDLQEESSGTLDLREFAVWPDEGSGEAVEVNLRRRVRAS
jgi:hypothetical protein